MRYLVIWKPNYTGLLSPEQSAQLLPQVILSFEILARLEAEKKIVAGGVFAGATGGSFILEAASNEELSDLLVSLPMWRKMNWEVTPLESMNHKLTNARKSLEQLKAVSG